MVAIRYNYVLKIKHSYGLGATITDIPHPLVSFLIAFLESASGERR